MMTPEETKARRAAYLAKPETKERARARSLAWYDTNRERTKPNTPRREKLHDMTPEERKERVRAQGIFRKYGVTAEEVEQTAALQNGCCAICFSRLPLVIDHCHFTGKFRALLCASCNSGIGMFNDSPVLLESAKSYLQKYTTI